MKRIMAALLAACMLFCIFIPAAAEGGNENEDSGYLFFSSFEDEEVGKAPKNGWTLYSGNGYVIDTAASDGKKCLYQEDKDNNTAPGYRSVNIPVTPGIMYSVEADAMLTEGDCQMYVEFWNASTRLPVNDIFTFNSNEWTTATLNAVAPEKAQTMTILLYQTTANAGTAYFDNIRVKIGKDYNEVGSEKYDHLVSGYPRLFFTKDNLPSIKALKDDTTPNYAGTSPKTVASGVISTADVYLAENSFTCNYYGNYTVTYQYPLIMPGKLANPPTYLASEQYPYWTALGTAINARLQYLAMAYLLTDDEKYARKATDMCLWLSEWTSWSDPTYGNGIACLDSGYITTGVCTAYDMLYDYMTDAEKDKIKTAIYERALKQHLKAWNLSTDHNIQVVITAALATAGCTLLGEYPEADTAIAKALEYFKWYLDRRLNSGTHEGNMYTTLSMEYLMTAADQIARAVGDRTLVEHKYISDVLFKWMVTGGENTSGLCAVISDGSLTPGFFVTASVANKVCKNGLAGYFLQRSKNFPNSLEGLIYGLKDLYVEYPDQSLQATYVKQVGWGSMRTGWSSGDTTLVFTSSTSNLGHNHFDNNSFVIARAGVWLASDPGYEDYSPGNNRDYTLYNGHSTIYVDGKPQNVLGSSTISERLTSSYFGYLIGKASGAYRSPKLDKFDRSFIMVNHPDFPYYVIKDDISASVEHTYNWRLNVSNAVYTKILGQTSKRGDVIDADWFVCEYDASKMRVAFASDDQLKIKWFSYPGDCGLLVDVTNDIKSNSSDYLALISVIASGNQTQNLGALIDSITLSNPDSTCSAANAISQKMLFFKPKAAGDYLSVPFNVPLTGTYNIVLEMAKARSYGSFECYIGDTLICEKDMYVDDYLDTEKIKLDNVLLQGGDTTIKFVSKGSVENLESFNIGAASIKLTATDSDSAFTVVSENIDTDSVRGMKVRYGGAYGEEDLLLFSKGAEIDTAGLTSDGSFAAVYGLSGTDAAPTRGYTLTSGTKLVYNGASLIEAASSASVAVTFETNSGSVIDSDSACDVKILIPEKYRNGAITGVSVAGEKVSLNIGEDGYLTLSVPKGKSYIDFTFASPEGGNENSDEPGNNDKGGLTPLVIGIIAGFAVVAITLGCFIAVKKKKNKK
ncbi:MAG: heparinase II/III family protein [Oscillospiraceae bacterium]|nr:heparinase II/III family protein [Oscillospiraceae bacterium]